MEEEIKVVEEQKKEKWTDDISINIPLTEFLKLKDKIEKWKKKAADNDRRYWDEWHRANEAERAYKALKADYEKLLGVKADDAK